MSDPIRVLIADDQHVVRAGIRSLLEHQPGIVVVGEAADGVEALLQAAALRPDVILLDLVMPRKSGSEAITAIKHSTPGVRILVLSGFASDDLVFEAIKAGASGYLLKTTSIEELSRAIHSVYRGETPLHPSIAGKIIRELMNPAAAPPRTERLTERELEILHLVARGHSNYDIGKSLYITEPTVRTHMNRILKKLRMGSRTQAALYALKIGLVNFRTK